MLYFIRPATTHAPISRLKINVKKNAKRVKKFVDTLFLSDLVTLKRRVIEMSGSGMFE